MTRWTNTYRISAKIFYTLQTLKPSNFFLTHKQLRPRGATLYARFKMKTLTENQQSIIDAITSEFNRINSVNKSTSFNLVDASKLSSINDEIKRNKEEAEAIKKHWHELAMDEAERLAVLLQQDLPMACVERFGKSNGKIEAPSVIIQRQRGICGHHENYVSFEVVVRLGEYVH